MVTMGDIQNARYTVPENTINQRPVTVGDLTPARYSLPENPLARPTVALSELVPASYAVPENIIANASVAQTLGRAMGCGCVAKQGMGELDLSSLTTDVSAWFESQSWTTWAALGVGALLVGYFALGGSGRASYREELKAAKQRLREKYPRQGSRLLRAARAASEAY